MKKVVNNFELSKDCLWNISEKKINFGKIKDVNHEYYNHEFELQFKIKDGMFSCSGQIYNNECCGQMLDDVLDYFTSINDTKFLEIHKVWSEYHLNDLKAYSDNQEKYLNDNNLRNLDYTKTCEELEKADLYIDKNFHNYEAGSKWLKKDIPQEIYELIKKW